MTLFSSHSNFLAERNTHYGGYSKHKFDLFKNTCTIDYNGNKLGDPHNYGFYYLLFALLMTQNSVNKEMEMRIRC